MNLLVVHHSATPLSSTPADIIRYHITRPPQGRGYKAVGYHWLIDAEGTLHTGRPAQDAGAHTRGHNTHSFGICLIGDNTVKGREWTGNQKTRLLEFCHWFLLFHPNARVQGHRQVSDTATLCPGVDIGKLLRDAGFKGDQ